MNSVARTKPVMDVAAPKSPALTRPPVSVDRSSISAMFAPARAAKPALRPRLQPQPPVRAKSATTAATPAKRSAPRASSQKTSKPAQVSVPKPALKTVPHRAPVALITVTVFVMLILSALAVTMYVTSHTA